MMDGTVGHRLRGFAFPVVEGGKAFLAWWLGELRECVPDRLKGAFSSRAPAAQLTLYNDKVLINEGDAVVEVSLAHVPSEIENEGKLREASVIVDDTLLLFKSLTLPSQARDDIHKIAALQSRQHFPLAEDQLVTGYSLAAAEGIERSVQLSLACARADKLNAHLVAVRKLGFEPINVVAASGGITLNVDSVRKLNTRRRMLPISLITILALQCMLVPSIDAARVREANEQLQGQLKVLLEKTKTASELKKKIDRKVGDAQFLEARLDSDVFGSTLSFLSKEAPADIYLNEIQFDGKTFRISGVGRDPAGWVLDLQKADRFKTVRLENVAASPSDSDAANFQIKLEIDPAAAVVQQ